MIWGEPVDEPVHPPGDGGESRRSSTAGPSFSPGHRQPPGDDAARSDLGKDDFSPGPRAPTTTTPDQPREIEDRNSRPADLGISLLTEAEIDLVHRLGDVYTDFADLVVGDGPSRPDDLTEFAARIHDLQHAVMAQAAARAYPGLFRLLGDSVDG